MSAVELVFSLPAEDGGSVDLVFGDDGAGGVSEYSGTLLAKLPDPGAAITLGLVSPVTVTGKIPDPGAYIRLNYVSGAQRPVVATLVNPHQVAIKNRTTSTTTTFKRAVRLREGPEMRWQKAAQLIAVSIVPMQHDVYKYRHEVGGVFQKAKALPQPVRTFFWQDGLRHVRLERSTSWQRGIPVQNQKRTGYQDALSVLTNPIGSAYQVASRFPFPVLTGKLNQTAKAHKVYQHGKFQDAIRPGAGMYIRPIVEPPEGLGLCYIPSLPANIVFSQRPDVNGGTLLFICDRHAGPGGPQEPDYDLSNKVIRIMNSMSLTRISDGMDISVNSVTVSADRSSWCWRLSAAIPRSQLAKVEPTSEGPVEVELELNGVLFRFVVETYSGSEQFATSSEVSLEGRSFSAYLDAPYALTRSYTPGVDLYSKAMAEAELPGGFSLDWDLVSELGWNIPASAWGYADLTPVQVIKALAEGVGGYLNSHPLIRELQVRPAYPVAPWHWATTLSDVTITSNLITSRSLGWAQKPSYNGVYVRGEAIGVQRYAFMTGTDGAILAPSFVSALVTDEDAAREAAIAVLGSGGKQATVSLTLPLESSVGLVVPGKLVRVVDASETAWKGLSRGVSISARWSDGLVISQSLELERHYY